MLTTYVSLFLPAENFSGTAIPLVFIFFGTNSRRFFQRNCFVFEKFWFWGTRIREKFFVQKNCFFLTDLGYVCWGGEGVFNNITFGFWDFLVQIQGDFSKEFFWFWEILVLGYIYRGGEMFKTKKNRHSYFNDLLTQIDSQGKANVNFFFLKL